MGYINSLSELNIRTKYITLTLERAEWDIRSGYAKNFRFTRTESSCALRCMPKGIINTPIFCVCYKPNMPIEAKDATHLIVTGMQKSLGYAEPPQVPFGFGSNGKGFLFYDSLAAGPVVREIGLDQFPSPEALCAAWRAARGMTDERENLYPASDHLVPVEVADQKAYLLPLGAYYPHRPDTNERRKSVRCRDDQNRETADQQVIRILSIALPSGNGDRG